MFYFRFYLGNFACWTTTTTKYHSVAFWVNRILTKTFDTHFFIKQLVLRGYYMLSTVRVTEDAAVSKMEKKNTQNKTRSSHEAYLQGRKDRQQTNT